MANDATTYLKYANRPMAAESLLGDEEFVMRGVA